MHEPGPPLVVARLLRSETGTRHPSVFGIHPQQGDA